MLPHQPVGVWGVDSVYACLAKSGGGVMERREEGLGS